MPTTTASVTKGVIHACVWGGLTTRVAGGTNMRALDLTVSAWAVARERFRFASASLASRSSIVAAAARRALAKLGLPVGRAGDAVVLSAFMPAGGDSGDDAALSVVASTMAVFLRGPEQACLDR